MRTLVLAAFVVVSSAACTAKHQESAPRVNPVVPAPYKVKVAVAKTETGDWECRAERRDKNGSTSAYRVLAVPGEEKSTGWTLGNREDDVRVPGPDGGRVLHVAFAPLHDPEGEQRGLVVVFEDISGVLASQRALAWEEMARQVAHEIKNPLTPIKLSLQHLQRLQGDPPADFPVILERNLDLVLAEIGRLERIAGEFSRFGAGSKTSTVSRGRRRGTWPPRSPYVAAELVPRVAQRGAPDESGAYVWRRGVRAEIQKSPRPTCDRGRRRTAD